MAKKFRMMKKDFPIIYTYIYERELDDIKRLEKSIDSKISKDKLSSSKVLQNKVITGFQTINGKITPVYKVKNAKNNSRVNKSSGAKLTTAESSKPLKDQTSVKIEKAKTVKKTKLKPNK